MATSALLLGLSPIACGGGGGPAAPIENPPITAPGDYQLLVASSGRIRGYDLHVPAGWNGTSSLPVLLVFHGVPRGNMRAVTGFDTIGDERGFAVVYAESEGQDWAVGCTACTNAARAGIDDVRFVEDLLDDLAGSLAIDSHRVWAAGFSQGAFMTHLLACEIPDRIAAFASVAATMIEQVVLGCEPTRKVPWIFVHGDADPVLPAEGQSGFFANTISIQTTAEIWAEFDGCAGEAAVTELPDGGDSNSTRVRLHDWDACQGGADVLWYEVVGGGHVWPGSPVDFDPGFGLESPDLDTSAAIADFVGRFSL
ncbi:MAG TPA: PHB depolymerase family esterase [Gemmatimonadota bacterium]|nr:PHB depolymerase family esterase [Gemmatimonadota bacterium]